MLGAFLSFGRGEGGHGTIVLQLIGFEACGV